MYSVQGAASLGAAAVCGLLLELKSESNSKMHRRSLACFAGLLIRSFGLRS